MPKRGQRLPYRVSYAWSNGVKGAKAVSSPDDVDMVTAQLERTAFARELGVTITVTHAATPGGPRTTLETRTIDPTRETP